MGIDAMKVYGGGDLLNAENSPFGKAMTPVQCIKYALTRPGVASVMVGCRTQDEIRAALDWCGASPGRKGLCLRNGRHGAVYLGRALHVLRPLRPLFGGNRHRDGP